ncbi:RNA polymerase sigma factor [Ferruginibacter sp. HRS2-29]|uniref:RNA polymerase sigma factor n=1 Tax=Ferruginibacter sp. HRS2-29 TaxID=2487334 RepID=UPI0020CC4068|nr:sigma-70 family RNA polymerase sigma factor [Ferruginibacter sp. HRS2-29]MCP9750147.1 sigma-70 family RNA polymerase sigma factor [Ferruginibacter sp. HRS2-29]
MPANTSGEHNFSAEVQAIKDNSSQVLQQIYTDNYSAAERYILQNNGSTEEAKDIFQEAFIAVWKNIQLEKFVPQNEQSLKAYLFQVSRNKWISHLRSSAYKKTAPLKYDAQETADDEPNDTASEYISAISKNMQKLGENCRDVLTRFYYEKESLRTIAAFFGWTEATARNNKYRCIEKLRNLLKNEKI